MQLDAGNRTTILVHYYRAMVGRADTWRLRMDTTTNWAIGATAALLSFSLGDPEIPHFVIFFSSFLTFIFLLLEARRLSFYHLWQQRVLLLERHLVARATRSDQEAEGSDPADEQALAMALEPHLGRTVPTMSMQKAVSRRLRRVYVYLFLAQVLAWLLKLSMHPTDATSAGVWMDRAAVGPLSGPMVVGLVALSLLVGAGFASRGGRPLASDRTPL